MIWLFLVTAPLWRAASGSNAKNESEHPLCIASHEQHKSAGLTLYRCLEEGLAARTGWKTGQFKKRSTTEGADGAVAQRIHCDESLMDFDTKRCRGSVDIRTKERGGTLWLAGMYSLSMASIPAARSCFWITSFREPVSRLMSAKFYCATRAKDPLCGNHREAWFERASASEMARYWGNYGFNNLLLADAFRGKVARGTRPGPDRPPPEEKVWQRYRRELQGGDDPRTTAGAANLEMVLAGFDALFDAVVVLERFSESLALLERKVPLPGRWTWQQLAARHHETHASEGHKAAEDAALAAARGDAAILAEVAGDARLYDAAVALFDRQIADAQIVI